MYGTNCGTNLPVLSLGILPLLWRCGKAFFRLCIRHDSSIRRPPGHRQRRPQAPRTNPRAKPRPPCVPNQSKSLTLFWPPARRSDSARRRLSTSGPLDNASPGPPAGHLRHPLRGDRRDREGPSPSAPRSLGSLRFRSPTFAILDLPAPNPESKSPRVFWAKHGNPPQTKTALSPLGQNRQPPVLPVKPADRDLPGSPLGRNSALTHQADGSQRRPRATTNADRCPWVAPSDGTKPQGFFSRDSEITGL